MDIGVETVSHFTNALSDARTIIWNGPMGVFEEPPFNEGTIGIARAVAEAADRGATVIVGGGDSVAAVVQAGVAERITHISTGGGATLSSGGEELPGVTALTDKASKRGIKFEVRRFFRLAPEGRNIYSLGPFFSPKLQRSEIVHRDWLSGTVRSLELRTKERTQAINISPLWGEAKEPPHFKLEFPFLTLCR